MSEAEPNVISDEASLRSIEILQTIQDCAQFRLDPENPNQICLGYNTPEDPLFLKTSERRIEVEDFLKAVDYYCENRDVKFMVSDAMTKPDGIVRVYSPRIYDNKVEEVLRIRNYRVPEILEFAYLLLRGAQTENTQ